MKKLLILAVVATLSFWGCSENSNLTGPTDAQSNQSFLKINTDNVSELSVEAKSALELEISTVLNKIQNEDFIVETIDGKKGGKINFELLSEDGNFTSVGVLKFRGNSFDGEEDISIAIDPTIDAAALDLGPETIELNKSAKLTVAYIGLAVAQGDELFFKYIADDGTLDDVKHSGIIVGDGWALVKNAQIKHFSRFGFTK